MRGAGRKDLGHRDHQSSRGAICACCGRKPELRAVTGETAKLISTVIPNYSSYHPQYPTSICNSCRLYLVAQSQDSAQTRRKKPQLIDYENLFPRSSRSTGNLIINRTGARCDCPICDLARLSVFNPKKPGAGGDYQAWNKQQSNPVGKKQKIEPDVPETMKVCAKCWSEIGRGKNHICSKSSKQQNLTMRVRQSSVNSKEKVVCNSLKNIANEQNVSTRGGSVTLQSGGPNKLSVKVGKSRVEDRQQDRILDHKLFFSLQAQLNCSDAGILQVKKYFANLMGNKSVEPYLQEALTERNRSLDSLFKQKKVKFINTKKVGKEVVEEEVTKPVTYADLPALVSYLLLKRELDPDVSQYMLGCDLGQGNLKEISKSPSFYVKSHQLSSKTPSALAMATTRTALSRS